MILSTEQVDCYDCSHPALLFRAAPLKPWHGSNRTVFGNHSSRPAIIQLPDKHSAIIFLMSDVKRFGYGQGQPNRNNNNNYTRRAQFTRGPQSTRGYQLPTAKPGPAEQIIISSARYVRGMELAGPGSETVKRSKYSSKNMGDTGIQGIFAHEGRGTKADPTVGWLFDVRRDTSISSDSQREHVAIAREVAMSCGFECILIRKEVHQRQCTYNAFGTRNVITNNVTGRQRSETAPSDPHMTVYMGPDPYSAMVGGHIYVVEVADPWTGRRGLQVMDDPVRQRSIVYSGEPVAEEFWLTKGAWAVAPRK